MKSLVFTLQRLSFLIFIVLAVSCKKDVSIDDENDEVFSMRFKFSGFTSQTTPLKPLSKSASSTGKSSSSSENYLYFWSFNKETLLPDIKFSYLYNPTIIYASGANASTIFATSTYDFEGFVGGKAATFVGSKEFIFKMPIRGVEGLTSLGFDAGSSTTGAKDFEIYYSVDKGEHYELLKMSNQFSNPTSSNFRHSYSYDLRDKSILADELWIMISPKAGVRGSGGSAFSESGVLRIDNFYLKGFPPDTSTPKSVSKLHYFVFDKNNNTLVVNGEKDLADIESFKLDLPVGDYKICFISNTSDAELMIPNNLTLTSFYFSNLFSNKNAEIFGYMGDLTVSKEQTIAVELERWFSQVKIEFTDGDALGLIVKVGIEQVHKPFFFAPYNSAMLNPVVDNSSIEFIQDFSLNKEIVLNQFLGKLLDAKEVSYDVHFYNQEGKLKTINLSSVIKNNMQLLFRGSVLNGLNLGSDFSIIKNEKWDGVESVDF